MNLEPAVAGAATVVAVAFGLATWERYLETRGRHHAAWSASLAMFAAGSLALALGATGGWTDATFRAFYLFGAILNVPFLAVGSVYLLAGRRAGDRAAVVVSLAGAFAAGLLVASPIGAPVPLEGIPQGSDHFGPAPRVLAALASGLGALVVFGGAAWSAVRARGRLAAGNGLLALGTLVLSAGGLFNSVLDEQTGFAVSLLVGVTLLFSGFLTAAGDRLPARRRIRPPAPVADRVA